MPRHVLRLFCWPNPARKEKPYPDAIAPDNKPKTKKPKDQATFLAAFGVLFARTSQLMGQCKMPGAIKLWQDAVRPTKLAVGDDHPETLSLSSMHRLAFKYLITEDWQNAQEWGLRVVSGRRRMLGTDHCHTRASMLNLGAAQERLGYPKEAQELYEQIVETLHEQSGLEHLELEVQIGAASAIINMLIKEKRWDKLAATCKRHLSFLKRNVDGTNPKILTCQEVLAAAYQKLGRYCESEEIHAEHVGTQVSLIAGPLRFVEQQNILSQLCGEPASSGLDELLGSVQSRSRRADEEAIVEGIKEFATLCGLNKSKYYDNELKGPNHVSSFTHIWNLHYSDAAVSALSDFRYQCPGTWSYVTKPLFNLVYTGSGPASEALCDLLRYSFTLDCEMGRTVYVLWGILSLAGRQTFDAGIRTESGRFRIAQTSIGGVENILFPFFDAWHDVRQDSRSRIEARTVFNDRHYDHNHPSGHGRLMHTLWVDDQHIVFNPNGQTFYSTEGLEDHLFRSFNAPRDAADIERLASWGIDEGCGYKNLTRREWDDSRTDVKAMGDDERFVFNTRRLLRCLEQVEEDRCSKKVTPIDLFARGLAMKEADLHGTPCSECGT